jgi:hypothetical protein
MRRALCHALVVSYGFASKVENTTDRSRWIPSYTACDKELDSESANTTNRSWWIRSYPASARNSMRLKIYEAGAGLVGQV